jgi:pyrimidine-nucleoside phosphorylase
VRAVDLIIKKRDGHRLSREELRWLINGYVDGSVRDYQMAAWAMAVLLRGMEDQETADLTQAMAESGDVLDLHDIAPITVDKHSTGGVGDKTSLVLGPLCAAVGLRMAKMSGRGLGFSGGTLDKLESIPGFQIDLSPSAFRDAVRQVGLVIAGQSADLAPADRRLYALRDVTGTVESIPLIAASVMSKKLAAGADCIVLDVKAGRGAFMKTIADARRLAETMVTIGQANGRRVAAILSSMEQPLGLAIGNALEIKEAILTLQGEGPQDLAELCLLLGAQLVVMAGRTQSTDDAIDLLRDTLTTGAAFQKMRAFVQHQGGDVRVIDDPTLLPSAPVQVPMPSPAAGYIASIDSLRLGMLVGELGGGRQTKEDTIDTSVGLVLHHKVGDFVEADTLLATIHARNEDDAEHARQRLRDAWSFSGTPVASPPLVYDVLTSAWPAS